MAANYQVSPPERFNFTQPREWPKWIRRFERFRKATELATKDNEVQVKTLIYSMGDEADDILRSFKLSDADKKKYSVVKAKFDAHFVTRTNVIYERAKFNSRVQKEGEPIDSFVTDLYALAEHCAYKEHHDEMIRDRIVVRLRDASLSEKLQLDEKLRQISCYRCGKTPAHDRQRCPAKDAICKKCGKRGHYQMTPTETRYAQIEKEALALTWACERYSDYLIGLKFSIETDHKPLVPLFSMKLLDELPLRVQRFRMRMMRYDFTISHVPGKDLTIADALSRALSSTATSDDQSLQREVDAYVQTAMASLPARGTSGGNQVRTGEKRGMSTFKEVL